MTFQLKVSSESIVIINDMDNQLQKKIDNNTVVCLDNIDLRLIPQIYGSLLVCNSSLCKQIFLEFFTNNIQKIHSQLCDELLTSGIDLSVDLKNNRLVFSSNVGYKVTGFIGPIVEVFEAEEDNVFRFKNCDNGAVKIVSQLHILGENDKIIDVHLHSITLLDHRTTLSHFGAELIVGETLVSREFFINGHVV